MSRGPGRWQRAILDELQRREVFYVRELLPSPQTRSDQLAVLRAAHRLAQRGQLAISAGHWGWSTRAKWTGDRLESLGAVIVARHDVVIDRIGLRLARELEATQAWQDHHANHVSDSNACVDNTYSVAREALYVARARFRAARHQAERARIEEELLRREEARARIALEQKRLKGEAELREKWDREFEQMSEAIRAQAVEALRPTPKELSAVATLLGRLIEQGKPHGDADIAEEVERELRWHDPDRVQRCVDQLRADGHYQRIIDY